MPQSETRHQCGQMEIPLTSTNHPLATAYLQNIATLTKLLRDQVQQCNSVNGDFARDVVAEIWRNFDLLDRYRREQTGMTQGGMRMDAMGDHSSMATSAPSEYLALREIGAERGAITPPSPALRFAGAAHIVHSLVENRIRIFPPAGFRWQNSSRPLIA